VEQGRRKFVDRARSGGFVVGKKMSRVAARPVATQSLKPTREANLSARLNRLLKKSFERRFRVVRRFSAASVSGWESGL